MKKVLMFLVLCSLTLVLGGCPEKDIQNAETLIKMYEDQLALEKAKPNPNPQTVKTLEAAIPPAKAYLQVLKTQESSGNEVIDAISAGATVAAPLVPPPFNLAVIAVPFLLQLFRKKTPATAPTS